jgi:hypothetical protein
MIYFVELVHGGIPGRNAINDAYIKIARSRKMPDGPIIPPDISIRTNTFQCHFTYSITRVVCSFNEDIVDGHIRVR